jgi:hypothetical protein
MKQLYCTNVISSSDRDTKREGDKRGRKAPQKRILDMDFGQGVIIHEYLVFIGI